MDMREWSDKSGKTWDQRDVIGSNGRGISHVCVDAIVLPLGS